MKDPARCKHLYVTPFWMCVSSAGAGAAFLLNAALQSLAGGNIEAARQRFGLCKDELSAQVAKSGYTAGLSSQLGEVCGSQVQELPFRTFTRGVIDKLTPYNVQPCYGRAPATNAWGTAPRPQRTTRRASRTWSTALR